MKSRACGESPKRFLRWSAAASFGREDVYSTICFNDSSSRGKRREIWDRAHAFAAMINRGDASWCTNGIICRSTRARSFLKSGMPPNTSISTYLPIMAYQAVSPSPIIAYEGQTVGTTQTAHINLTCSYAELS